MNTHVDYMKSYMHAYSYVLAKKCARKLGIWVLDMKVVQ